MLALLLLHPDAANRIWRSPLGERDASSISARRRRTHPLDKDADYG
jgi:hypothetical protein